MQIGNKKSTTRSVMRMNNTVRESELLCADKTSAEIKCRVPHTIASFLETRGVLIL